MMMVEQAHLRGVRRRAGTTRTGARTLAVVALLLALAACENPAGSGADVSSDETAGGPPPSGPEPDPAPAGALRGGLVVNEVLADPTGATEVDTDGNGTAETTDEFVELHNAGAAPADAGGLELWDPSAGNWFTVPPDAVIEPGASLLVVVGVADNGTLPAVDGGSVAYDAGHGRGIINNGGDAVVLLDPGASAYLQIHYNGGGPVDPAAQLAADGFPGDATGAAPAEDWGSDTDGSSLARNPDGTGAAEPHIDFGPAASPGAANAP